MRAVVAIPAAWVLLAAARATAEAQPQSAPAIAVPDMAALIRTVREHEKANEDLLKYYAFTQEEDVEEYDGDGVLKKKSARKIRVVPTKDDVQIGRASCRERV